MSEQKTEDNQESENLQQDEKGTVAEFFSTAATAAAAGRGNPLRKNRDIFSLPAQPQPHDHSIAFIP